MAIVQQRFDGVSLCARSQLGISEVDISRVDLIRARIRQVDDCECHPLFLGIPDKLLQQMTRVPDVQGGVHSPNLEVHSAHQRVFIRHLKESIPLEELVHRTIDCLWCGASQPRVREAGELLYALLLQASTALCVATAFFTLWQPPAILLLSNRVQTSINVVSCELVEMIYRQRHVQINTLASRERTHAQPEQEGTRCLGLSACSIGDPMLRHACRTMNGAAVPFVTQHADYQQRRSYHSHTLFVEVSGVPLAFEITPDGFIPHPCLLCIPTDFHRTSLSQETMSVNSSSCRNQGRVKATSARV